MGMILKGPKGTQDVLPKDSYKWKFVENTILNIASTFHFKEIRIPTFEHTDLFCRSVGDTSDVVEKEMYTFEDKSSRLITLRPEGTAGTLRSVIEHGLLNGLLPLKLFYILSCFRYENLQTGRLREFHQFGAELLGPASPEADFEVIKMGCEIFKALGITNFLLEINSIGCSKCSHKYKKQLMDYMSARKDTICPTCLERLEKNPMRILDCKDKGCQNVVTTTPIILDSICDECKEHLEFLKNYLNADNIEYIVNPKIVRGLDYYVKTVFEFIVELNGSKLTVCGGGRYDNLINELGGPKTSAVGFAIGLERIVMILDELSNIKDTNCDLYIAVIDNDGWIKSIPMVNRLRSQGYIIEIDLMNRSLKSQMKYANKIGAKYSMVIGSNEIETGRAKIKNMSTSEEQEVDMLTFSLMKIN